MSVRGWRADREEIVKNKLLTAIIGAAALLSLSVPAPAQTFQRYQCSDGADFVTGQYERKRILNMQVDGRQVALTQKLWLSGTRYSKGDVALTLKGDVATLKHGGRLSTDCRVVQTY